MGLEVTKQEHSPYGAAIEIELLERERVVRDHQLFTGTVGLEFITERPGALRLETTILEGSLLPVCLTQRSAHQRRSSADETLSCNSVVPRGTRHQL